MHGVGFACGVWWRRVAGGALRRGSCVLYHDVSALHLKRVGRGGGVWRVQGWVAGGGWFFELVQVCGVLILAVG